MVVVVQSRSQNWPNKWHFCTVSQLCRMEETRGTDAYFPFFFVAVWILSNSRPGNRRPPLGVPTALRSSHTVQSEEEARGERRRRRRLGFPPLSLSPPHPHSHLLFFWYRIVRPIIGGNRRQPRSLERARTRLRSPPVCLIDSAWVGERFF